MRRRRRRRNGGDGKGNSKRRNSNGGNSKRRNSNGGNSKRRNNDGGNRIGRNSVGRIRSEGQVEADCWSRGGIRGWAESRLRGNWPDGKGYAWCAWRKGGIPSTASAVARQGKVSWPKVRGRWRKGVFGFRIIQVVSNAAFHRTFVRVLRIMDGADFAKSQAGNVNFTASYLGYYMASSMGTAQYGTVGCGGCARKAWTLMMIGSCSRIWGDEGRSSDIRAAY